jgi:acetoin utilization deacetylase AcuC-like enzyme
MQGKESNHEQPHPLVSLPHRAILILLTMKDIGFFYSDAFSQHRTPEGHPERPHRLEAIVNHLKGTGMWTVLRHLPFDSATEQDVLSVHSEDHLNLVRQTCAAGGGMLDEGDTHAVEQTCAVALLAAGAVAGAVDAVLGRTVDAGFCAVRPPGHHAERDRPMGFCIFNNVAIGARHAQQEHGIERVAILDWDVHHGNGTQHIFEKDSTVFYVSLHRYPFYPGTGSRAECGMGKGEGYTLNVPLPAGTGEERYLGEFKEEILPVLETFKPELLLISAGFDAHQDDPLGGMELTENSFAAMTHMVMNIAPVVSVLEGGYNLDALGRSVVAHLKEMQNS